MGVTELRTKNYYIIFIIFNCTFMLVILNSQCEQVPKYKLHYQDKILPTKPYSSLDFRTGFIDTKIDSLPSYYCKEFFIKLNFTNCDQHFNVSGKNKMNFMLSKDSKLIFKDRGFTLMNQQIKNSTATIATKMSTTSTTITHNISNLQHSLCFPKTEKEPTESPKNIFIKNTEQNSRSKCQQKDCQHYPSLDTNNPKPPNEFHEYCVIGAGPAGLQMGYFLSKSDRDYIILEKNNISGSFFTTYPRHRKLISINKRFTGNTNQEFQLRHDWNSLLSDREDLLFKHFSSDFFPHADSMVDYLNEFKRKLGLKVSFNTHLKILRRIKKSDRNFSVFEMEDQNQRKLSCRYIILATGLSKPNKPPFGGENFVEGYEDISLDTRKYEGKNVLILGRGNAAFETAESLYGHTNFIHMVSRSRARFAWNTHYVGDLRAVNNGLLDTYQLKSLDGLLEAAVEEMSFVKKGSKLYVKFPEDEDEEITNDEADGQNFSLKRDFSLNASKSREENAAKTSEFPDSKFRRRKEVRIADNFSLREGYHHVIRCLGFKFDFSIFNSSNGMIKFVKEGKYPAIKETFESSTIPNLFVAGVIAHSLDYRKSAGGFIHGFRYTARALHRLLEWRNHKIKWPSHFFKLADLLNVLLRRMNEASGPYQMFGVLADVIILNNDEFTLIEEYPVSLFPRLEDFTGHQVKGKHLIVMIMEYGEEFSGPDKDTFRPDRATGDPLEAHRSNFLHPVLYFYEDLPKESDLFTNWNKRPLPKPHYLHHVLEDFLTTWTSQQSHILPLRRFLETATKKDIRNRFVDSCLTISLTNKKVPLSCRQKSTFGTKLLFRPRININDIS